MSDDLAAFMARMLDEDEAAAKAAWGVEWDWRYVAQPFGERPSIAHTVHIARHDPARALREVEAKRAILAGHRPQLPRFGNDVPRCSTCLTEREGRYQEDWSADPWPCLTVRATVAAWSDHPDYRPGWGVDL